MKVMKQNMHGTRPNYATYPALRSASILCTSSCDAVLHLRIQCRGIVQCLYLMLRQRGLVLVVVVVVGDVIAVLVHIHTKPACT